MEVGLKDYREVRFSFDILALYLNRLLMQTGIGIVGLFEIIFLFTKFGESIEAPILIYILVYVSSVLLTPISAFLIAPLGMRALMLLSMPFLVGSTLALLVWDSFSLVVITVLYILSTALYRVLYWLPYHVDFATFTDKKTRGRQVSILLTISSVVTIITPLAGGFILAGADFNKLFIISLAVLILAGLPLFFVRDKQERYSYGYFETYKQLFKKENRPLLLGYISDGAQTSVTAIVWPIFIYLLLKGEYFTIGLISSLTILVLMILRLVVGDLIDTWSQKKVLVIGAILNTTGWFIKVFIQTGFQIFIVDTYHGVGKMVNRLSVDVTTYTQAADNGHYIDEFTVLKEIALNLGRVLMLSFVAVLIFFFSIKLAFLGAAIASLFVTVINKQVLIEK